MVPRFEKSSRCGDRSTYHVRETADQRYPFFVVKPPASSCYIGTFMRKYILYHVAVCLRAFLVQRLGILVNATAKIAQSTQGPT